MAIPHFCQRVLFEQCTAVLVYLLATKNCRPDLNGRPWDMNVFKPEFAWPPPVPSMKFLVASSFRNGWLKGAQMDQKTLTCTPRVHRNLYPFLALLCVRACDSPKRSAPAAVFTCSRSLAIAAFYLVVALWKMESWKDILRIFVDKFSLQVRCILCSWKRNCLTVWIHLQVATPNHSRARPLRGWYVSAKRFAATKRSCNRETVNKRKEPKMYHKKQGLNNHSEEDIKMGGFEAKASSKRFALGFMIKPTVRN